MSLNENLNRLGTAVHQASVASQELEKELVLANDRVGRLADKHAEYERLVAQIQNLIQEKTQLEADLTKLRSLKNQIVNFASNIKA